MAYRFDPRDRAKSLGLVVAVHVALGLALIAGLRGPQLIRAARERLTAIEVPLSPPPPPPRPEPAPSQAAPRAPEGKADHVAKPAPVVVPTPPKSLPSPLPVAREAGPVAGTAATAGAGPTADNGNGAGRSGTGEGGGGTGAIGEGAGPGSGARWLGGGLSRGDYRAIRAFAVPAGSAAYAIRVDASGRAVGCRPRASSGSAELDAMICDLLVPRLQFEPARDALGRARPDEVTYVANWSRR